MVIENIRLPQQSRDQLTRLKRITGIENWNTLCRWALCLSLADKNSPPRIKFHGETAVDISWRVFAGDNAETYLALLLQRAHDEKRPANRETISELLRSHVSRGIGLLTARRQMSDIAGLLTLADS